MARPGQVARLTTINWIESEIFIFVFESNHQKVIRIYNISLLDTLFVPLHLVLIVIYDQIFPNQTFGNTTKHSTCVRMQHSNYV